MPPTKAGGFPLTPLHAVLMALIALSPWWSRPLALLTLALRQTQSEGVRLLAGGVTLLVGLVLGALYVRAVRRHGLSLRAVLVALPAIVLLSFGATTLMGLFL